MEPYSETILIMLTGKPSVKKLKPNKALNNKESKEDFIKLLTNKDTLRQIPIAQKGI